MRSGAGKSLIGSTFFMFAFHECFSSAAGRFWLKLSGTADCIAVFAAYVATAVTLAVVSYAVYLLLKRLSPRCLDLITGHRS